MKTSRESTSSITHIAVIGGGAAGMIAAATILESSPGGSYHIDLFEGNKRLGAKVLISGGGRCNVTTGTFKRKELLTHYTRGAEFLDYAFRQYGPKKIQSWFEDHGIALKQEADGRIFPVSDDGNDIVGLFERIFGERKERVSIRFGEKVRAVSPEANGPFILETTKGSSRYEHVIIATGGQAFSHTGSQGDGYAFARSCGHTITPLGPSLNSFVCKETRIHNCTGISFPRARIHISSGTTRKHADPVLLTHFGISGPHTFVVASHSAFETVTPESPLLVRLQPDAEMGIEARDQFFLEQATQHPKKQLGTVLGYQLPKRFVEEYLTHMQIDSALTMTTLPKATRKLLALQLGGGLPLTLIKRRPGDEFVTAGGVVTDEVDPKTMQSKITPGLYFAGEVLNVDGVTGGYNLQSSWATGILAGEAITTSF